MSGAKAEIINTGGGGGGGGGTVTSVGLTMPSGEFNVSPATITSSGTFSVTYDNQNINQVFASPATGLAGQPSFRALTIADLPVQAVQGYFMNITRNASIATSPSAPPPNFIDIVGDAGSSSGFNPTESVVRVPCPYNITITSLRVDFRGAANFTTCTIRIRSNAANVGTPLTINNGAAAGIKTQSQTLNINQDDLLAISVVVQGGSGSAQLDSFTILYTYR